MIVNIKNLQRRDIDLIILEAKKEGYNHVNRLLDEYEQGKNRFENRGELLIGFQVESEIIGICGLNIEPSNKKYGRIRRLYVLREYRKTGIGSKLVNYLLEHATGYFSHVTTNIGNLPVGDFYKSLGFEKSESKIGYTHVFKITK